MAYRSIVKHSYLLNDSEGVGTARAHIRYLQFRPGKDRDGSNYRTFFSATRSDISKREVEEAIHRQSRRRQGVLIHKLILSPGVPNADMEAYTREVMAKLASPSGKSFNWFAVKHENTANPHAHVVIMGHDHNGLRVRFDRDDYIHAKQTGDRFLDQHGLLDAWKSGDQKSITAGISERLRRLADDALRFARFDLRRERLRKDMVFDGTGRDTTEESLGRAPSPVDRALNRGRRDRRLTREKTNAWNAYNRPLQIAYGTAASSEPVIYTWKTPLNVLREVERDYIDGDKFTRHSLSEDDVALLRRWIRDAHWEQKNLRKQAAEITSIELDYTTGDTETFNEGSTYEQLQKLHNLHKTGKLFLSDDEQLALKSWMNKRTPSNKRTALPFPLSPKERPHDRRKQQ